MQVPNDKYCRKVLHVIMSASIGGIEKLVLDLAMHHANDPRIITGIFFIQPLHGEFSDAYTQTGLDIHSAGLKSGYDFNPFKLISAWKTFRQYDVIHVHCFNVFIAMMAVLSGQRIIYSHHRGAELGREPRIADHVNRWLLKQFLTRFVSFNAFNSHHTKVGAVKLYGLENVKGSVIYNGVPVADIPEYGETIDADILGRLNGRFVIGTSSRFASFKRIDRLIDAFSRFMPGKEAVLLLVGDGPLFDRFRETVDRYGMADSVIFSGFQTNVRAYQNVMDVCVFPSESEPFGLVSIEAYSLGKPVIVFSDGGGLVEIVSSLCLEDVVEDIDGLAKRMEYYYNNRYRTTETDARKRIEYAKKFDISIMAEKFRDLYLEN
jgi:glycosyltransferase involved in cell wall biosynthesis